MKSRKLPAPQGARPLTVGVLSVGGATKKILAAATTALLVASALVLGVAAPASAAEECVPQDAWTETIIDQAYVPAVTHTEYQRYSWTKPQNQLPDNPLTTPQSAPGEWQANTTNYEGAGHGTDQIGIAFDTGHPGNGNWFFWTETEAIDTPAIEETSHTVDHPAVTCEEPTPTVAFSYSADCGALTLTTVSTDVNAAWYYGTKATVDGVLIGSAVQQGSGTKVTVIPFDEDSYGGSVDVVVETYASTEQDLLPTGWELGATHLITVITDCTPPNTATAVTPTATAGTEVCVSGQSQDATGFVTLDAFIGGHWEFEGATVSGTVSDLAPGQHDFTAVADDGYEMEGQTLFTVTVPASTDVDCIVPLPDRPTWTDPCGVDNGAWTVPADGDGISWSVVDNTTLDGTVGIVATLTTPGKTFPGGATTTQWTADQDNTLCEIDFDPTITLIAPAAFDATCEASDPQGDFFGASKSVSGYIQLDLNDHLHYSIDGVPTSSEKNDVAPGEHTVTVTVDEGFKIAGNTSWTLAVNDAFCDLETHALLSTSASKVDTTCTTQGSYTLADTEGIMWFVNGSATATAAGTYQVAGASTVNVEARLVDTVNDGWEEGAQQEWSFTFTDPADCLPTLAFTGSDSAAGGSLLATGFLLAGGMLLVLRRRLLRAAE